ncbi:hypothetical protein SDC9_62351 [bioreactor metagenome]|uniref:Uncharacterized protein n=1 Tax=bioreactor metagenome TaxID=1076179 RepID=A0A644XJ35_9ZZZZ
MESTRHKGIVLHGVAEDHQFGAAEAALIGGECRGPFDDPAHFGHCVHVDARPCGADIHRGADQLGGSEGFGNSRDEPPVPRGEALLHQGGEPADKVDAALFRRPIHGDGKGDIVFGIQRARY